MLEAIAPPTMLSNRKLRQSSPKEICPGNTQHNLEMRLMDNFARNVSNRLHHHCRIVALLSLQVPRLSKIHHTFPHIPQYNPCMQTRDHLGKRARKPSTNHQGIHLVKVAWAPEVWAQVSALGLVAVTVSAMVLVMVGSPSPKCRHHCKIQNRIAISDSTLDLLGPCYHKLNG
jgi:hypothetical protein